MLNSAHTTSTTKNLGDRFAQWIVRSPWKSLTLAFVLFGSFLPGLRLLQSNFTHTAFFYDEDPLLKRFNAFERQFGNDDTVLFMLHSPSGVFNKDMAELVVDMTERIWKLPEIIRVDSLSTFNWVHTEAGEMIVEPLLPDDMPLTPALLAERKKVAFAHESLPYYLLSPDGKTTMLYGRVKPSLDKGAADAPLIMHAVTKMLAEIKSAHPSNDYTIHVAGAPPITNGFEESARHDVTTLLPIVLIMIVLFLALSLRSLGGVVYPMTIILLSAVMTVGAAGYLHVEISTITTILPHILIAIGVADSVHILSHFYRSLRSEVPQIEAAEHALSYNVQPTLLTTISTAIGFLAFSTSTIKSLAGLGLIAGLGTLLVWLMTYLLMGPLMRLVPAFVRPKDKGASEEKTRADTLSNTTYERPWVASYVRWVHRWRKLIVLSTLTCAVLAGLIATQNTVNSDPYRYFSTDTALRQSQEFMLNTLRATPGLNLTIRTGKQDGIKDPKFMRKVDAFENEMENMPELRSSTSIVEIVKQTHRSLHDDQESFYAIPDTQEAIAQELMLYSMNLPQGMDLNDSVNVGNDALRIRLMGVETNSTTNVALAHKLEARGKELNLNVQVDGKMYLYQSMNGHVVDAFIISMSVALVLISLMLAVYFRSLRVGLLALIPNLIPLVIGGALLIGMGQSLDIGTVLVFSVCLGIAVDDTIHLVVNSRRYEASGIEPLQALTQILSTTGPALITTTVVLVAAFGTFSLSNFVPNANFGFLTAIVLSTALVFDLLFLPALLLWTRDKETTTA